MDTKTCTNCGETKPLTDYTMRRQGNKMYPTSRCRVCHARIKREARQTGKWKHNRTEKDIIREQRYKAKVREERRTNTNIGRHVLRDCRQGDQRKGRECDLDRSFVDEMIAKPCLYCGDTTTRMTLDRIDNTLGHLKSNVVPACYRCNVVRGDMPYDAWMCLVPGMKMAREQGKFGDWKTRAPSASSDEEEQRKLEELRSREEQFFVTEPEQNVDATSVQFRPRKERNPHPRATGAGGRFQRVSDDEMTLALQSHPSISKALESLGMAPKGKNYTRAKRLLGIPPGTKLKTKPYTEQDITRT